MKSILVLGGYGATGTLLSRHLLAQTESNIILAGRHVERAQALIDQLGSPRLSAQEGPATW